MDQSFSEEERDAAKRRINPLMRMLLGVKTFECALMKLLLEVGRSQPPAEATFNTLQDMLDKLSVDMSDSRRQTLDMLYGKPFTIYDRDAWEQKLKMRRFKNRNKPRSHRRPGKAFVHIDALHGERYLPVA